MVTPTYSIGMSQGGMFSGFIFSLFSMIDHRHRCLS